MTVTIDHFDIIIVAIIGSIAPTIAAAAAWRATRSNRRIAQSTHDLVNSRMTELLRLAREEAKLLHEREKGTGQ